MSLNNVFTSNRVEELLEFNRFGQQGDIGYNYLFFFRDKEKIVHPIILSISGLCQSINKISNSFDARVFLLDKVSKILSQKNIIDNSSDMNLFDQIITDKLQSGDYDTFYFSKGDIEGVNSNRCYYDTYHRVIFRR